MRICILILLLITLTARGTFAQGFSVSGRVTEDDGKPIYGAQVFLSGTSKAGVSDKDGYFALSGLTSGTYELVVNLLGYKTYTRQVQIDKKSLTVDVRLSFNVVSLKEVVVQPDRHWEENYETFKKNFFGSTANAPYCKILNPQVLHFSFDANRRLFEADSGGEFLIIENKALGYKIKYLLLQFRLDFKAQMLTYEGKTAYEDLEGSSAKVKQWNANRIKAYQGSPQHFLTSLYRGTTRQEGYVINRLIRKPNPDRPSDSLISLNIQRLTKATRGRLMLGANDSLDYWINKRKLPRVNQFLVNEDVSPDSLLSKDAYEIKRLVFSDCLYVTYTQEREAPEYRTWQQTVPRPLDQPNFQTSVVTLNDRYAGIDPKGSLTDPLALFFEGYWAFEKVADLLPYDYTPPGGTAGSLGD